MIDAIDTLRFITRSRIADAGQMKLTAARQAERRIRRATEDNRKRPADLGRLRAAGINVEFRSA